MPQSTKKALNDNHKNIRLFLLIHGDWGLRYFSIAL